MDKILEQLGNATAYVIAGFIYLLVNALQKRWDAYKSKKGHTVDRSVNLLTRDLLTEIRTEFDCDRVKLFQFKNGEYYLGGRSEQKLCLTNCAMRLGVTYPDAMWSQNTIPFTLVEDWFVEITKSRAIIDEKDSTNLFRQMFAVNGTVAALACQITSAHGKWIGILMLTWMEKPVGTVDPNQLQRYQDILGRYLDRSA